MRLLDSSGIRKVFDMAAAMKRPIDFSIGQPHFDVPDYVKTAAISAIRRGRNRYTVTQGIPSLRAAIQRMLKKSRGIEPEGLIVTSGVTGGLFLALQVLVNPGDEVIFADPYFVMYKHITNLCGGVPVCVDTYPDFTLTAARLAKHITPKTRMVLLNSPSNPTGRIIPAPELKRIAALCRKHKLLVISDEIYDCFAYEQEAHSIASIYPNTLLLGGFSKSHALTGWRVGYAAGPKEITGEMAKLQQYSFVCAPSFAQEAAAAALGRKFHNFAADYRRKRDLVYKALVDAGYDVVKPDGAFYFFPRCPWGTDQEFVAEAIRRELLIIPGSVFSERNTQFRMAYAASDSTIARGLKVLRGLAK